MREPDPELLSVSPVWDGNKAGSGFPEVGNFIAARQHALLRSAFLITGDLHLAEDLVQDALIKLALNWSKIHTDPESYVRTILYRDAVSWWRRRRRELVTGRVPDRVQKDSSDDSAVRVAFAAALAQLTPKQRAVLVLRYYEDLPVEWVAEVLGVSAGTVKSQTHVALRRLRDVVDRDILDLAGLGEELR